MTHQQRFHATLDRQPVDRPASWLGIPTAVAVPALLQYFGVADLDALRVALEDDIYPVEFTCGNSLGPEKRATDRHPDKRNSPHHHQE